MNNKLWVEAHSPKTISDCILPSHLAQKFQSFIDSGTLPNLLLVGEAGTGKTTVAKLLAEAMGFDSLLINASLQRGIETVREQVVSFSTTSSLVGGSKVIILDEADNLTEDAQKSLRGLVEDVQNHCRFILTANYEHNLIPPLRSRMTTLVYRREDEDEMVEAMTERLKTILTKEGVGFSDSEHRLKEVVADAYPNWRQLIHSTQASSLTGTLQLPEKDEALTTEALLQAMTKGDTAAVVRWVTTHDKGGGTPSELATLLGEVALATQPPTNLPNIILTINSAEATGVSDSKRHSLNIALQALTTWE